MRKLMFVVTRFLLASFLTIIASSFVFSATAQEISFEYDVDATKGWQTTTLKVTAGQSLNFSAVGKWNVDFRNFSYVGPEGYSSEEDSRIYQGCKLGQLPYGTLLVRVGDNPSFQAIGSKGSLTADRDGYLAFRIHDGDACLVDNAGSVRVTVTGSGLASATPLPYFYCITSQVPTDSQGGVCQSAYTTPVPNWQQISEPESLKWLNSPNTLDCLNSISFLSELSINYAPGLRKILENNPKLLKRILGETKESLNFLDALTLAKSIFEKFYDKVIAAKIPVAPIKEEDEKRILIFLMQAAAESIYDEVTAKACRDGQAELGANTPSAAR